MTLRITVTDEDFTLVVEADDLGAPWRFVRGRERPQVASADAQARLDAAYALAVELGDYEQER